MATRVAYIAPTCNTDANFRLWINEIHNALIALGWVQTADTGQIVFSTVTRPTSAGVFQGFATYHMNDSFQATCAVFMRLDFGSSSNNSDAPAIKVQVCIGSTNGTGTLTGQVASQIITATASGPSTVLFNVQSAGDAGSFRMSFWLGDLAGAGWHVAIERDQDTSGNDTANGVTFLTCVGTGGSTASMTSQFLENSGGTGTQHTIWHAWVSAQPTNAGYGGAGVGPVHPVLGYFRNPMKTVLLGAGGDWVANATTTVSVYGVARTYLIKASQIGGSVAVNNWNAGCRIFLLWQ